MTAAWLVAVLFSIFIFLDMSAIYPRIAGTIVGKANTGYSFQIIINTLKRVFVVAYPPILGVILLKSGISELFATIGLSYLLGLVALALAVLLRTWTISLFESSITAYSERPVMFRAIIAGLRGSIVSSGDKHLKAATKLIGPLDWAIAFSGAWIFTAYFGATFTVNLVSERFPVYAPIILQLGGLINAIGTLVLAFVYDPRLSRRLDHSDDHGVIVRSVIAAYLLCLLLISPAYFGMLYFLLS